MGGGIGSILYSDREVDVVVFPSIDRAARSVADMIDIDAILRDAKVEVIFVREGVDTSSPMGQFFRNVCASVAQFEGKLMYERLTKGKQRKAAQGGYIGGHLPFGYRNVDSNAVVDEEAAEIVRLIFRMRIKENSFPARQRRTNVGRLLRPAAGSWQNSNAARRRPRAEGAGVGARTSSPQSP